MKYICIIVSLIWLVSCNYKHKEDSEIFTLPSFKILLLDSTTIFNSDQIKIGNSLVFIYFTPDCIHCQQETTSLLKNIDRLKNTNIYLVTPVSISELKAFYQLYNLEHYKNIITAKDYEFSFYKKFKPSQFPYIALYNSQKKLIRVYLGSTDLRSIVEENNL